MIGGVDGVEFNLSVLAVWVKALGNIVSKVSCGDVVLISVSVIQGVSSVIYIEGDGIIDFARLRFYIIRSKFKDQFWTNFIMEN
jgi:hypothetical protein